VTFRRGAAYKQEMRFNYLINVLNDLDNVKGGI